MKTQNTSEIKQRILKGMSPKDKWNESLKLRETAWKLKEAFVRLQHPDWDNTRVTETVTKIFLYATT